jgi:hypothetical protein
LFWFLFDVDPVLVSNVDGCIEPAICEVLLTIVDDFANIFGPVVMFERMMTPNDELQPWLCRDRQ